MSEPKDRGLEECFFCKGTGVETSPGGSRWACLMCDQRGYIKDDPEALAESIKRDGGFVIVSADRDD